jgi:GNAT superfamily N-acetyltransferase
MKCDFSWIDSPWPIDLLGPELWRLLCTTVQDGAILGIDHAACDSAETAYLQGLRQSLAQGSVHLLIGSIDGRLVLSCLMRQQQLPTTAHIAELQKGVIAPECRGRGLLRPAFRAIVEKAGTLGVQLLTLDVREASPAHRLWRSMGFRTFGLLEDYARFEGQSYRGHYMQQRVQDLAARLSHSSVNAHSSINTRPSVDTHSLISNKESTHA